MSVVYGQHHIDGLLPDGRSDANEANQSMDGRHSEYSHSDQASASHYTPTQDSKYNHAATPTSEYGVTPSSARSATFPNDYLPRTQYPDGSQRQYGTGAQGNGVGTMAQPSSPSLPLNNGAPESHQSFGHPHSNAGVPIDPNMTASSPQHAQYPHYAPYPPPHEMGGYPGHAMYPRPGEYPYAHPGAIPHYPMHAPPPPPHHMMPGTRPPAGGHPLSTVYSFVPIPGTHQQKRPRRRYEEIERMYKCGWNGCEKAYGTLNHLNAHVTMQSHGQKRTPEEFKEIRKEWKQRKKDEENARKVDEDRQRQHHASHPQGDGQPTGEGGPPQYGGVRQLPPIGYAQAGAPQYGSPVDGMPPYSTAQMQSYYPHSPYGQHPGMYHQPNHAPTNGHEQQVAAENS